MVPCNDIIKKKWCSQKNKKTKKTTQKTKKQPTKGTHIHSHTKSPTGPDSSPTEIKEDFVIAFSENRVLDTICVQFICTFAYPNDPDFSQ